MKYFVLPVLLISSLVFAQANLRWVERSIEVEVPEKNPNVANHQLIDQATQKISLDMIKEIIGEAKFNRNQAAIQTLIVKTSNRYIPVSKSGDLTPTETGHKMVVTLRVSQDDLQAVLLENGLFYDADTTPTLLPVFTINDQVSGASWSWWKDQANGTDARQGLALNKINKEMELALRHSFWKNSFYVERPQGYRFFQVMTKSDKAMLANQFNSPIYIDGEISINKMPKRPDAFQIDIHLMATQTANGRSIGEVNRKYETEAGKLDYVVNQKLKEVLDPLCADLSAQVLEAWQKGALGANLFRLAIHGHIPIGAQENLKTELRSKMREIKNVRERFMSMDEYDLEIDSSLSPTEFAKKMPLLTVGTFTLKFETASDKEAVYKVIHEGELKK